MNSDIFNRIDRLSTLLEIALIDARAIQNDRNFRLQMYNWVVPSSISQRKCLVCLAGAVLIKSLRWDQTKYWKPDMSQSATTSRLFAIDSLRAGSVQAAFNWLTNLDKAKPSPEMRLRLINIDRGEAALWLNRNCGREWTAGHWRNAKTLLRELQRAEL